MTGAEMGGKIHCIRNHYSKRRICCSAVLRSRSRPGCRRTEQANPLRYNMRPSSVLYPASSNSNMTLRDRTIEAGELVRRAGRAVARLSHCDLCPRRCGVDRLAGKRGFCATGRLAEISSATVHGGEEPPISGTRGSGTIFFTHCNLACIHCQNHQISQGGAGRGVSPEELAAEMLELQKKNVHNINLVSPSHCVAQILEAVPIALAGGLKLPVVYNCGGYDSVDALELLEGVVDVYLPDMKYGYPEEAERLSGRRDYVEVNRRALKEMFRQAGPPVFDADGIIRSGLIVRHLVLPEDRSGTYEALCFIAEEVSTNVGLSLMAQYRPMHKAEGAPDMNRPITANEYRAAIEWAGKLGFETFWVQKPESAGSWVPDFNEDDPFRSSRGG